MSEKMIDTSEMVNDCPECGIKRAYCDSCGVEYCCTVNCELYARANHKYC